MYYIHKQLYSVYMLLYKHQHFVLVKIHSRCTIKVLISPLIWQGFHKGSICTTYTAQNEKCPGVISAPTDLFILEVFTILWCFFNKSHLSLFQTISCFNNWQTFKGQKQFCVLFFVLPEADSDSSPPCWSWCDSKVWLPSLSWSEANSDSSCPTGCSCCCTSGPWIALLWWRIQRNRSA